MLNRAASKRNALWLLPGFGFVPYERLKPLLEQAR